MKDVDLASWRVSAAYLYTLTLDPVGLAWEYLRRNTEYRVAWGNCAQFPSMSPAAWGLKRWEDPDHDARFAVPIWSREPSSSIQLTSVGAGKSNSNFQLWRISGQKALVHDGTDLHLTATHYPRITRVVLDPALAADQPYAYLIPAGGSASASCRAVNEFDESYRRSIRSPSAARRTGLVPTQILQAIDGANAGATHRDLAVAILGDEAVKERWSPDGELRARIRYLLKRGRALSNGGYRALLSAG